MTKNKLIFLATALSLVSSAAVFAADKDAAKDNNSNATVKESAAVAPKVVKMKRHTAVKASSSVDARIKALEAEIKDIKKQSVEIQKQQEYAKSSTSWNKLYAYGPAIVTTPIIGEPRDDGYDLYVNLPSVNEDLALLHFNKKLANYYTQNNLTQSDRPIVALSGEVEGQVLNSSSFNDSSRSDINLSYVVLEAVANVNSWVTGLIRLEYNDTPPDIGARVTNSEVKVNRAYVTVGNLNEFPLYATIGQLYVPFGVYNNYMITDPLTKTLGRTRDRALVVGFDKNGAYGSVFTYAGDSYTSGPQGSSINSWGANLGYVFTENKWSLDFGASYIANIADSLGMQDSGFSSDPANNRTFEGFKNHEKLGSQVPAADVHALFTYQPFVFIAEYISTLKAFDKEDMTFNGSGAKPKALDLEGVYNFNVFTKPAYVSAGFGESWESLAINMPKYSYFVSTGISIFKDTVASVEYRHDINYDSNDISTGGKDVFVPGSKTRNIIIGSFKFFF